MKNRIRQEFVLGKPAIGMFAAIAGGSWLVGIGLAGYFIMYRMLRREAAD